MWPECQTPLTHFVCVFVFKCVLVFQPFQNQTSSQTYKDDLFRILQTKDSLSFLTFKGKTYVIAWLQCESGKA